MKILLTSDMYENQINGVSCSVITLRDELRKKGHDVRVLTLSKDGESKMEKTDYLIGSFSVPFYKGVRQTLKLNDPIIDDIVLWHPDIVHIQTEFAMGKVGKKIARRCRVPYIHTCHTLWEDYTKYLVPSKKLGKVIARKLVRSSLEGTSAVIVPTDKIRSLLKRYEIDKPVYTIPTGIDLDRFYKKASTFELLKLKAKYGISNKSKVLLSLGRVAYEKNLIELVNYMPDLINKDKNIVFLICGDGPYKKTLEKEVHRLKLNKYVIFTGMIEPKNTYKYYQLGDIFVCASQSETQGVTYIEAQASSLPLVCRYDECLKDVIDNEENGYMYKNKNQYINYVLDLLNSSSLRKKIGNKALISSNRYSKENFANDIEKLYLSVIEKESGCSEGI